MQHKATMDSFMPLGNRSGPCFQEETFLRILEDLAYVSHLHFNRILTPSIGTEYILCTIWVVLAVCLLPGYPLL